jgi:phospholipid/cholesterol/gamma-HCH transport system permease protein
MVARSSSAVASELAHMRANGEFRCLARHGIDIGGYLLLPRMLGMTFAAIVLSGFSHIVAKRSLFHFFTV